MRARCLYLAAMAPSSGPWVDLRLRWRAGLLAVVWAGLLAVVALLRPLASEGASPGLRLSVTLALGLGVAGSALLASLKGRGQAAPIAFYAFLVLAVDALGQVLAPLGWPVWPLMALLVAAVAVAEGQLHALGVAALATLLAAADAAAHSFTTWRAALAGGLGYVALALAVHHALLGEKRRLASLRAELARLTSGIEQLDAGERDPAVSGARATLRQASEEGRRARQLDRAAELDAALSRLAGVARAALDAHAVLYFDLDRERDAAVLRAVDAAETVRTETVSPLSADPFAFVLDRRQSFYATDFKRLLWSLPYYRGEVRVGSLLAVPVLTGDVVAGLLVADKMETQALTGREPGLLASFAEMAAEAILHMRASLSREEMGAEFKAVYEVSHRLTASLDAIRVRALLLRSALELVPPLESAAVVLADNPPTRYRIEEAHGWAKEFEGREVATAERTWTSWVLRSAEEPYLLDDVAGGSERMPVLVLDEGWGRAESLLALPLKARGQALGALVLTGRRGAFDASALRVLGILANQAAAALLAQRVLERAKEQAVRDGLTDHYNRREFTRLLQKTLANADRQGGSFALLLFDIDHFKKLNDTYGHPAGDAALRNTAQVLERHLRKGDQAARYGGEEFAAILPGADEAGALHLAERVREAIAESRLVFEGARLQVTVSLGVAVWPADGKDEEALVGAADRALYAAKEGGRNRVVAASTLPAPDLQPSR
jgi:diguanylate cyclase (GGDEF)-like protein